MQKLEDESIDLVVTSPPYNIGKNYGTYKDNLNNTDYLCWVEEWVQK
ncbi:MAG: DNA methyltransferase, partial [Nanoarchaeota archaeon]